MKYLSAIIILICTVSAQSNTAYIYNPDYLNLFYKACDCSNSNINFCIDLIDKVSQANSNNAKSMKDTKTIYSATSTQFQNDIKYHNKSGIYNLSCYDFADDSYKHNTSIIEALKAIEGWRE